MGFFDIFKKKQDSAAADIPESRQQQQEELSAGLEKTKTGIFSKLARAVAGRSTVDADLLDDVEEVLITSDVGVETTVKIIRRIEERVARDKYMNTSELQSILREEVMSLMEESHGSEKHFGLDARQGEPYVVMVVGVNGAGKTTTIGKLAAQLTKAGLKVWIGAADTFRAAAIDQLKVWADRAGATMIRQEMGSDPASVAFDTLTSAKANGADVVLIDTAGRLHNKVNLMNELGEAIGEEGTIGDKATGQPYSSIYAPGVNIHRSPFGGRCSEYFSEDPFISGMMGAAEVQGVQRRGVLPTVKHFVANEQETHRSIGGDLSWLSEQALREIYLKPFEYTVKLGETRGIMTSFNRIGTRWTGGDYRLLTEILRNEWGFNGLVICDFNTIPQYMIPRMMFYAGGSLDLATQQSAMWTDCDSSDAGDAIVLMRAVKDVMYALVNSNAMNAEVIGYNPPIWQEYLHWINIGAFTLVGVWLVLAIVRTVRCNKRQKAKIAAANAAK